MTSGELEAQLLRDLVAERLFSLDPVRLAQRGQIEPGVCVVVLAHRAAAGRDIAAHEVDGRAVGRGLEAERFGRVFREKQLDRKSCERAIRRRGAPGVSRRRQCEPFHAERAGHRDRRGHAASLERAGGIQRLVLQKDGFNSERRPQETQGEERRHPLAQGHGIVGSREDLGVAPEGRRSRGDGGGGHRARGLFQAVAREEDAAAPAQTCKRRRIGRDVATGALEPLEG